MFALHPGSDRQAELTSALRAPTSPRLADLLAGDEVMVDLSVVRDRFCGMTSFLTVWCRVDIGDHVSSLAAHFEQAYDDYLLRVPALQSFEHFFEAIGDLVAAPGTMR